MVIGEQDRPEPSLAEQQQSRRTVSPFANSLLSTHGPSNTTYLLIRPDPDLTLVVVSESSRKLEKDQHNILLQLQEMSITLKGTKVFELLKSGALLKS